MHAGGMLDSTPAAVIRVIAVTVLPRVQRRSIACSTRRHHRRLSSVAPVLLLRHGQRLGHRGTKASLRRCFVRSCPLSGDVTSAAVRIATKCDASWSCCDLAKGNGRINSHGVHTKRPQDLRPMSMTSANPKVLLTCTSAVDPNPAAARSLAAAGARPLLRVPVRSPAAAKPRSYASFVLDGLGGSLKRLLAAICAVSSSAGCWCSGGAVPLLAIAAATC